MARVFVSHSHDDRATAQVFAKLLEDSGHEVWWDFEIPGGAEFRLAIDEKLEESDVILVLWSPSSVKSNWVLEEAQDGLSHGKLLPITIRDTLPPRGFREVQAIDFTSWDGELEAPELKALLGNLADFGSIKNSVSKATPGNYSLKKASQRNVLVAIAASMTFLAYSGWDYLDPSSTVQPRARLAICAVLLVIAGIAWFVRSAVGASVVASVICIFSSMSATLMMLSYDSNVLGLLSPSAALNICLALIITSVYSPIQLRELVIAIIVSIAFFGWAMISFTNGGLLKIGAAIFNLIFIGAALLGFRISKVRTFQF